MSLMVVRGKAVTLVWPGEKADVGAKSLQGSPNFSHNGELADMHDKTCIHVYV